MALAERYFRQAAEIDLANNMGNAAGGVHAAALGGLWQAAVFGFAGLRFTGEKPEPRPNLPAAGAASRCASRGGAAGTTSSLASMRGGEKRSADMSEPIILVPLDGSEQALAALRSQWCSARSSARAPPHFPFRRQEAGSRRTAPVE